MTSQPKQTNVKGNPLQNADQIHDDRMAGDVVFVIDDNVAEDDKDACGNDHLDDDNEDIVFLEEIVNTNEDLVSVASNSEQLQADVADASLVVSSSGSYVDVRIDDKDPSDDRWKAHDTYESSSHDDLRRSAFMSCDTKVPEVRLPIK